MDFNLNTLDLFFKKNKIIIDEGSCSNIPEQYNELIKLCKQTNPLNIMEIGFNAGNSSELFLKNSNAYIYSFDIGEHFNSYLKYGKMFINYKFPNRHTLVFGDSRESIIKFHNNHPDKKFDIIFIDGGHDYEIAISDLLNCRNLAHQGTILIMDDIVKDDYMSAGYTLGPTKAWNECVTNNIISETNYHFFGKGRGMCVGNYIFN
jgi:predicted O-methyltransferase YrrM